VRGSGRPGAAAPGPAGRRQPTLGDESDERGSLIDLRGWIEDAPAWLASAVLHLLVLIVATMIAFGAADESPITLSALFSELGEQTIEEPLDLSQSVELDVEEQLLTPDDLAPVEVPLATPTLASITPHGPTFTSALESAVLGAALSGREPGSREALLKAYGGTAKTEAAVLEGLRWLVRMQDDNGSWSLAGPYPNGARRENREAATAMALLAFQGAGHLPSASSAGEPTFSRAVARGWDWMLKKREPVVEGCFFSEGGYNHRFYTHAQATIALCELMAMTGDDQYRSVAQKAIDYLIETQGSDGGWKYLPGQPSDLSVTGWCLMALKSGRIAGLEVDSAVFARISEFLDKVERDDTKANADFGARYVYEEQDLFNREEIPAMTAEGLLCRQFLGWPRDESRLRQGIDYLLTFPPEWRVPKRDVYYWYYATQVLRHYGGEPWEEWNSKIRVVIPENQDRSRNRRVQGSWDPRGDKWGEFGGRLYETCLSIYILEVYYRHLPIYQERAVP
jgi:hypothetical protein